MLELEALHTYYGDSHILQGVSLSIGEGGCVAILGRNGAGKSTTLRSVLGYVPPRRGRVLFKGEDITGLATWRIIRRGIGYVPEDRGIFRSLTVAEHLNLAYVEARRRPSRLPVEAVYDMFPRLKDRRGNYGDQLSGGEQQMLAIGRALIADPELLILDEPSEGLAPVIIDFLAESLGRIVAGGKTMLLVEQNLRLALALAHHVHILVQGRLQWSGTAGDLERDDATQHSLLGV